MAWLSVVLISGCASISHEPPNLYPHKLEVRGYFDSGRYQRDLEAVAVRARNWLEQRAAKGGTRLTIVFDLDETLLLNWPYLNSMDFGYVPEEWDRWVREAKAPPIESVRELYRAARRAGVDVVFLTGRRERQRDDTLRNLRGIDCAGFAALICKPDDERGTAGAFKTAARRRLTEEGRTIIANIGDQESDLVGGYAERTFKLPNPFYLIE